MIRILAFLILSLPGPALALSCIVPNLTSTYKELRDVPEAYVIVYGKFAGIPVRLSQTGDVEILRYQFSGNAMTRNGIGPAFDHPVVVTRSKPRPEFADPGGSIGTNIPVLTFLQKSDEKYLANVSVCSFRQFYNPTKQDLQTIAGCLNGQRCRS